MKRTVSGIILTLLLVGMSTSAFHIQTVKADTIDPTVAGTPNQIRDPLQRHVFYFGNREWIFYNNASQHDPSSQQNGFGLLISTTDGSSFTSPIVVTGRSPLYDGEGEILSLFYNPTTLTVDFVWANRGGGGDYNLYYRRGYPQSNGTIVLNNTQTVYSGTTSIYYTEPTEVIDTNNTAWICVQGMFSVSPYTMLTVFVNANNNGIWVTNWSYNLTQASGAGKSDRGVLVRLLDGKVGCVYQKNRDYVYYEQWASSSNSTPSIDNETASLQKSVHGDFLAAVAVLDDVHMSYLAQCVSVYNVIYRYRNSTYNSWSQTETIIFANDTSGMFGAPMSWDHTSDSIRVFYEEALNSSYNHIFYRQKFSNGTWASPVDWYTETGVLTDNRTLQVSYETSGGENITVAYEVQIQRAANPASAGVYQLKTLTLFLPVFVVDNKYYQLMNVNLSLCDINHDLKVDVTDIAIVAIAFLTAPGDPLWNPHADITGPVGVPDGKVDMRDIGLVARHFGEHL